MLVRLKRKDKTGERENNALNDIIKCRSGS